MWWKERKGQLSSAACYSRCHLFQLLLISAWTYLLGRKLNIDLFFFSLPSNPDALLFSFNSASLFFFSSYIERPLLTEFQMWLVRGKLCWGDFTYDMTSCLMRSDFNSPCNYWFLHHPFSVFPCSPHWTFLDLPGLHSICLIRLSNTCLWFAGGCQFPMTDSFYWAPNYHSSSAIQCSEGIVWLWNIKSSWRYKKKNRNIILKVRGSVPHSCNRAATTTPKFQLATICLNPSACCHAQFVSCAAFTWNPAAVRWQMARGHLLAGTGHNKQFNGTAELQNEVHTTVCCYGAVLLFTKNGTKPIELFYVYYLI